jgi:hypothetical protein
MNQYPGGWQAYNNETPMANNDEDFTHFKSSQIDFPTGTAQFSQPQREFTHRDQSAAAIDFSGPHGPRHKPQRSNPDVAQESRLPKILGLLTGVSPEEREKIMAVLREQDQSSGSPCAFWPHSFDYSD